MKNTLVNKYPWIMNLHLNLDTASRVVVLMLTVLFVSPGVTYAGWGLKDFNIIDKNSGIRKSGRQFDQQRLDAGAYNFYLHNKCPERLNVKFEYIPRGASDWQTTHYTFGPGEHGRLDATRNSNVYVAAKSTTSPKKWDRKMIDMGSTYKKYTYNLTCGY